MIINDFINKNKIDKNKLIKYGFNKSLLYTKDLFDNLYVTYEIKKNDCFITVYDNNYNEEYLPFNIKNNIGNYVSKVKEEVELITQDIINNCGTKNKIIDNIFKYVKEKYNTIPNLPFKDNTSYTLTTNNKWYGLIMHIKGTSLGLKEEIDIINLKHKPDNIINIVDNDTIYNAYHMNKKYWITIRLDKINEKELFKYIDESYNLVNKK